MTNGDRLNATAPRQDAPSAIIAAMLIGAAAMMVLGLQPILLGSLTAQGRLSEAGLGQAAMVEILAFAAGAAAGSVLMRSGSMRVRVILASLILITVNLGMYAASSPAVVLMLRGAAGLMEGLLLSATLMILTHSLHPARMNGLFMAFSTAPQIAGAYLLPAVIMPRLGLDSGFAILASLALIAMLAARFIPDTVEVEERAEHGGIDWTPSLAFVMLAAFIQSAGIGAAWSYTERLGHQHGMSPSLIGAAIAASLLLQCVGALAAAWLSAHLLPRIALVGSALVQVMIVGAMAASQSSAVFIVATCLFGLFWLALQPFLVAQLLILDRSRGAAIVMAPILLVGLGLGPLLVSFSMHDGDVRGGFWWSAGFFAIAGVLYYSILGFGSGRQYRES